MVLFLGSVPARSAQAVLDLRQERRRWSRDAGAIGRTAVRERSVVEALRMLMELARGPQAAKTPRREAASHLRQRMARRHAVKRRRTPR